MKEILPGPELSKIVKYYSIMDKNDFKPVIKYSAVSNSHIKVSEKTASVSGQTTCPVNISIPDAGPGFAFSLQLGGIYCLFGIPAGEFTNRYIHLSDILGHSAGELIEKILSTSNIGERISFTEVFLTRLIDKNIDPEYFRLQVFISLIGKTETSVSSMAAELGISSRHFQRITNTYFGMGANMLKRILRFEKAVKLIRFSVKNISWVKIAYACGYSDQSHFIREFKEFSGCAPGEFLRILTMSESFNTKMN